MFCERLDQLSHIPFIADGASSPLVVLLLKTEFTKAVELALQIEAIITDILENLDLEVSGFSADTPSEARELLSLEKLAAALKDVTKWQDCPFETDGIRGEYLDGQYLGYLYLNSARAFLTLRNYRNHWQSDDNEIIISYLAYSFPNFLAEKVDPDRMLRNLYIEFAYQGEVYTAVCYQAGLNF
ncbi:MAG: hypothetical protein PVJ09_03485 [Candidatus Woesebacteria bacterium]|jgi:hypothetical protein